MPARTFREFLTGPAVWPARSAWHPMLALLVAMAVVVIGQLVPIVAIWVMAGGLDPSAPGVEAALSSVAGNAALLLLTQAAMALMTLLVAGRGLAAREALYLTAPIGGARDYLYAILLMVPLLAILNAISYSLSPSGFIADFKQFADFARSDRFAMGFLAIAVGAPLWEELLFRGFLLAPLTGAIGFWPASVLVSGLWTILHIGYSIAGLTEVFLIGLYFSWLLYRTGSLWVPIACHAAYNACVFTAIRYLPV